MVRAFMRFPAKRHLIYPVENNQGRPSLKVVLEERPIEALNPPISEKVRD
jgi:hypothetical protein